MIVAGALEKEAVLHPFLGNVARRLVREARCAVMLFTRPAIKPRPLRRIVFVADYSDHGLQALKMALPFAAAESCERLYVIRIITTFDQARESIRANARRHEKPRAEDEEAAVEEFVLSAGATDVPIEARLHPRQHRVGCLGFCSVGKSRFARGAAAEKCRGDPTTAE